MFKMLICCMDTISLTCVFLYLVVKTTNFVNLTLPPPHHPPSLFLPPFHTSKLNPGFYLSTQFTLLYSFAPSLDLIISLCFSSYVCRKCLKTISYYKRQVAEKREKLSLSPLSLSLSFFLFSLSLSFSNFWVLRVKTKFDKNLNEKKKRNIIIQISYSPSL